MPQLTDLLFILSAVLAVLNRSKAALAFLGAFALSVLLGPNTPPGFLQTEPSEPLPRILADCLLVGILLRNAKHPPPENGVFRNLKNTLLFFGRSCVGAPFVTGLLFTLINPSAPPAESWAHYALPRAGAFLSLFPVMTIYFGHEKTRFREEFTESLKPRFLMELGLWIFLNWMTGLLIYKSPELLEETNIYAHAQHFAAHFLMAIPIFWSAFRFPVAVNVLCLAVLSIGTFVASEGGMGPFHNLPLDVRIALGSLFNILFGIIGYAVKTQQEESRMIHNELETRVAKRTRELAASERFASTLFENIPDMIIVKNAEDLKYTRVNRAAEELLGRRREELVGHHEKEFLQEATWKKRQLDDEITLRGGALRDVPDEEFESANRGKVLLHTRKIPLPGDNQHFGWILSISEDITARNQVEVERLAVAQEAAARKEAERLVEIRDYFLKMAAHELKTPISALQLSLELALRKSSLIPSEQRKAIPIDLFTNAVEETRRLTRLIDHLLDVTKIDSGGFDFHPSKRVNITDLLKCTLDKFVGVFQEAGCSLSMDITDSIEAEVDPDRIQQVFQNLLSNAAKYGKGMPVSVKLDSTQTHWRLMVEDQGIGIPMEKQTQIFDRFNQTADRNVFPGMGLGLFLTREIVRAQRGIIRMRSIPGKGTTFIVECPKELQLSINQRQAA